MVTFIPAKDDWAEAGRGFGQGLTAGYMNRSDENAVRKAIQDLGPDADARAILDALTNVKTYSPAAKQQALSNFLGVENFNELKKKNQIAQQLAQSKVDAKATERSAVKSTVDQLEGYTDEEKATLANTLSPSAAGKALIDQKKPNPKIQKQLEEEETLRKIQEVRSQPGYDELDEVEQYKALTDAGVPLAAAERESKIKASQLNRMTTEFDKSYDAHKKFIDDTTNKYKAFETDTKPKLQLLSRLATDEELISPTVNKFRQAIGLPLGALDNPNSELFEKTSLDLLKGLPETYGNRILKVEVDNFLKTVPSLENSPEGRRMIASNLLKLGELKETYFNTMRSLQKQYLDTKTKFPKDFEQQVLEQAKPQLDRINNEFIKLTDIRAVPKDTIPFFDPSGNVVFVPKDRVEEASLNGGKRIW
jgi:hypothetical protein